MSSELGSLYSELFEQFRLLNEKKTGSKAQQEFNAIWGEAKAKCSSKDELAKFAKKLLAEYRQKNSARKSSNILYYYTAANKQVSNKNCRNNNKYLIFPRNLSIYVFDFKCIVQ